MKSRFRKAARSFAGKIALANAADGHALGLHPGKALRDVADDVAIAFQRLPVSAQNDDGLCGAIRDVCRGPAIGGARRGSSHLCSNPTSLAGSFTGFSTVVLGADLARLIDPSDLRTLFGSLLVTRLASGGIDPGSLAERRLMDRSPSGRARRQVRLAAGASLGNPIVWMTKRESVDRIVAAAARSGVNVARAVTDRLGLSFPPFDPINNAMNQRFVLHLPAAVVMRKRAFRPTAVEAAAYIRFKVRSIKPAPPPAGWGRTLHLGKLAAGFGLADGLDEITFDAMSLGDFSASERIELEYLGTLPGPRGVTPGRDCDATVATLMANGRSVAALMGAFR